MGWDNIKEKTSKFVKIPAGKSARVHFLGEPADTVVHYIDKKYVPCTASACQLCIDGNEKIDRFSVQVFNMDSKLAQTFEASIGIKIQIRGIWEAYGKNIDGLDFVVSRGEGSPVKYTVVPVPTQFRPEMLTAKAEEVPF